MMRSNPSRICLACTAVFGFCLVVHAEDAAPSYYLAILELNQPVPDYVDDATSDDPSLGFAVQMANKQISFLQEPFVLSALSRFDYATSCSSCDWRRYKNSVWSDASLNVRLHRLARIGLLRARLHYEHGEWSSGNLDVERVRILARHMALQARPWEHQCFMIENMAMSTSAAYVLRMPVDALADLSARHSRVGSFEPMCQMLIAEAARVRLIAYDYEAGRVATDRLLECMDPFLSNEQQMESLRSESKSDAARLLRNLATFLDELSRLINRRDADIEVKIKELVDRHGQGNILLIESADWSIFEYRENAQAVCRAIMFGEVVDQLKNGRSDFANIADPYGKNKLTFRKAVAGFTLVSELVHDSNIDFRFGLAGKGE